MRRFVSGIIVVLLVLSLLVLAYEIKPARMSPTTIIVPDDYPTIQGAINHANEGDTVFVRAGTYYEHVILNKTISLIGEDKNNTTINGNQTGGVISIMADGILISEFTIQGGGSSPPVFDSGIYVNSSHNVITSNIFINNKDWSIWLDSSTSNNTISYNYLTRNWRGIMLRQSIHNKIIGNNMTRMNQECIYLWNSSYNTLDSNSLSNSKSAIAFSEAYYNNVTDNTIADNVFYGIEVDQSYGNLVYHNNFLNNRKAQVYLYSFPGSNIWNDGYPSGGNYWSDLNPPDVYSGLYQNETGKDKIGDLPYIIDENNTDRYPLIYPYGFVPSVDVNNDGFIDIFDIVIVVAAFGTVPGDPNWNPIADLNKDEIIDIFDLVIIAAYFGQPWKPF